MGFQAVEEKCDRQQVGAAARAEAARGQNILTFFRHDPQKHVAAFGMGSRQAGVVRLPGVYALLRDPSERPARSPGFVLGNRSRNSPTKYCRTPRFAP